jgi:hypothetical protein
MKLEIKFQNVDFGGDHQTPAAAFGLHFDTGVQFCLANVFAFSSKHFSVAQSISLYPSFASSVGSNLLPATYWPGLPVQKCPSSAWREGRRGMCVHNGFSS